VQVYKRVYPYFALCGLNCGLCPRYHTAGDSRCPGCGGPDFHLKHPSCSVITCNRKHDNVEFCFQCSEYPCERYKQPSRVDSFITYRNVLTDFADARDNLPRYKRILNDKVEILGLLIDRYNDGKRKNFYCIAVNLLPLEEIKAIMNLIKTDFDKQGLPAKDIILSITKLFTDCAKLKGIELELRK
jgi:hypothetical protein